MYNNNNTHKRLCSDTETKQRYYRDHNITAVGYVIGSAHWPSYADVLKVLEIAFRKFRSRSLDGKSFVIIKEANLFI